jgi:cysteinyl-tRNA synthetase
MQMVNNPSSSITSETTIQTSARRDFSLQGVKETLISADSLTPAETDTDNICRQFLNKFDDAMSDDLNTPRAVAELFALVSYTEKLFSSTISSTQANIILQSVYNMDLIFGLFYSVPSDYFPGFNDNGTLTTEGGSGDSDSSAVPEAVIALAQLRMEAKKSKQFTLADSYRDQISELGFIVKDKKDGFDLVRK